MSNPHSAVCRFTLSHHPENDQSQLPLITGNRVPRSRPLTVPEKMQAIQKLFPGKQVFGWWEKPHGLRVNNFAAFTGSYKGGKYCGRIYSWHRFYVQAD